MTVRKCSPPKYVDGDLKFYSLTLSNLRHQQAIGSLPTLGDFSFQRRSVPVHSFESR